MKPAKIHKFLDSEMFQTRENSKDPLQQEDLESIARENFVPWESLKGKTILITGATGLIGSQITRALCSRNRIFNSGIQVIALVRNISKAVALFADLKYRPYFKISSGDVGSPIYINDKVDYIIHTASITSSKDFVTRPVETIETTIQGTRNVLDLARKCSVQGMLYLSSLEVYGTTDPEKTSISEKDSGYIDPLQIRSSYSEGKRMAECLCVSYASEYNVPVKIARLAQTFGTGVDYNDRRVFAEFARDAIEKKDIVLKTKGETVRNYCYTSDAITAILTILVKGAIKEAYNIASRDTEISIADMAEFVCREFSGGESRVVFDIAEDASKLGYNPVVKIQLNTEKLEALGWKARMPLKEMFRRTIESMRISKEQE